MIVDGWEIVTCCLCGSQVLETVSENGTMSYRPIPEEVVDTIGELQEALLNKDPDLGFEILVQNNPDHVTNPQSQPERIVILVAGGDFLRLN